MSLPKAVQRELDQANQILAAQAVPVVPDPNVATDVSELLTSAAPATPPVAEVPPAPTPPAPTPPAENWEQRFKTLQGMHNREVPELRAQNKTLESRVVALTEQVNALTKAAQTPAEPKKPAIDDRDVQAFGADMMEMVQRYVTGALQQLHTEFTGVASAIDGRVTALEQQVTGVSERTSATLEQQFYATLRGLVPNFEEINEQPRWLEWLAEKDPLFGAPRQAALDNAFQNLDAERVAGVFRQFLAMHPAPAPTSLEAQRSPNGGGAAPAPTPAPAKKSISSKTVERFYNDVARGRFKGREAEQAAIEAEINLAAAEGRIV